MKRWIDAADKVFEREGAPDNPGAKMNASRPSSRRSLTAGSVPLRNFHNIGDPYCLAKSGFRQMGSLHGLVGRLGPR
jgi:hypothetical protein